MGALAGSRYLVNLIRAGSSWSLLKGEPGQCSRIVDENSRTGIADNLVKSVDL